MSRWVRLFATWVLAGCGLLFCATDLPGQSLDPRLPWLLRLGKPAGLWPHAGQRSGTTEKTLPSRPTVLFRGRVSGSLDSGGSVDQQGRLTVSHGGYRLTQIDQEGREVFTLTTASQVKKGPVLLASGLYVAVTDAPLLIGMDAQGKQVFQRALSGPLSDGDPDLLALTDGGLAIAIDQRIYRFDSRGALVSFVEFDERVAALGLARDAIYSAARTGQIFVWRFPQPPRQIADAGGRIGRDQLVLAHDKLLVLVDGNKLVGSNLDSPSLKTVKSLGTTARSLSMPVIVSPAKIRMLDAGGFLLDFDFVGHELNRVAVTLPTTSVRRGGHKATTDVWLLVDETAQTAFAHPELGIGVVSDEGLVIPSAGVQCARPSGLMPAGRDRLWLTCRSGHIWLIGNAARANGKQPKTSMPKKASESSE